MSASYNDSLSFKSSWKKNVELSEEGGIGENTKEKDCLFPVCLCLADVGDYVQEGELLAVIDTDKVSVDVTAPVSGRLVKIDAREGDTIEVGKPLYVIDTC